MTLDDKCNPKALSIKGNGQAEATQVFLVNELKV